MNNWIYIKTTKKFNGTWEDGANHFRRNGYKFPQLIPSSIIPMEMVKENEIEYYDNAIFLTTKASASTYNQPKDWKGEVQIKDASNVWWETVEGWLKPIPSAS